MAGAGGALVGGIYGGVSAWAGGQDVGSGIVRGALIGGLAGVTGGAAGLGAGSLLGTGTAGAIASGVVGGVVGDVAAQGAEVALGYRCSFDAMEALGAGLSGGVGAAAARGFARFMGRRIDTSCFPAGTPIRTQEGDKPIEKIRAGDVVLSADPATGKQSYRRVKQTFTRTSDELLTIETADGRQIEATPEHPFWVEGKGFVVAKRLARSDLLKDADGRHVAVAAVTARRGTFPVYNFEVEGTHTYYAAGWWVHNECGRPSSFYHYTTEAGEAGILADNAINPSLVGGRDARYGSGVYLTDLAPGSMTPGQIARRLFGQPFGGRKLDRFFEIDVSGLPVQNPVSHIFLIPTTEPLDLTGRIIRHGIHVR